MRLTHRAQLPRALVRDLLGIVRALGAFVEGEAQVVAPMVRAVATKLFNK